MEEATEMSYDEIMATLILSSEVILTVAAEETEKVKTGLKNLKARQNNKLKEQGLEPDPATLIFEETISTEFDGCIDLRIILKQKGSIKVRQMKIPDGDF